MNLRASSEGFETHNPPPTDNFSSELIENPQTKNEKESILSNLLRNEYFPRQSLENSIHCSFSLTQIFFHILKEIYWEEYCIGRLRFFSEQIREMTEAPLEEGFEKHPYREAFLALHRKFGTARLSVSLPQERLDSLRREARAYGRVHWSGGTVSLMLEIRVVWWLVDAWVEKRLSPRAMEVMKNFMESISNERPRIASLHSKSPELQNVEADRDTKWQGGDVQAV